jgi:IS605 OrfB family transposase
MSEPSAVFTYQARLELTPLESGLLDAYAGLYGQVERSLFAAMRAGLAPAELKPPFQKKFGITARQFNAAAIGLKGKIASVKERRPQLIDEARRRIAKAGKALAKLEKKAPGSSKLHHKKRRLETLKARLAALEKDQAEGVARICFGGKKLFNAQFNLEAAGYGSHEEWLGDWQAARSGQFFVIGSKGETGGCQGCTATKQGDGLLTLRLRLPDALASGPNGKYLVLPGVRLPYGLGNIEAALDAGTAISYRFLKDGKGWRVFATAAAQPPPGATHRLAGAVGIDVNDGHMDVAEVDRFGNLTGVARIDCPVYGKTPCQAKAAIGDAAKQIVERAKAAGKPIVMEKLDFAKKKAELEAASPGAARGLSALAYARCGAMVRAAAFRSGVEVIEVNPAYTSVIGAVNHAQRHGISTHQGAAFAVARRGMGLSERPAVRRAAAPVRNGGHVTFDLPARNRSRHVWSFWSGARARLKAAHAAHFRSGRASGPPGPLPRHQPALGSTWILSAESRHANPAQHCSGQVLEDVPW